MHLNLKNALKFTEKGGVTITSNSTFVENDPDTIEVEISCADTGIGVDPTDCTFIFDRFAQVTQRSVVDYGGSGLGLFIGRKLAELMGGRIWMESNTTGGSTFIFTVTVKKADKKQVDIYLQKNENDQDFLNQESVSMHLRRKLKVLIVEDNKINQKVLLHMLADCNCRCDVANNGLEGLNKFLEERYDLIYMVSNMVSYYDNITQDIVMPVMNGYDCTMRIRQIEKERGEPPVPIIGLSGNVRSEHHESGYSAGMTKYLNKPVQKKQIISLMSEWSLFKESTDS
jgi:CheY-like chemotaxis protein